MGIMDEIVSKPYSGAPKGIIYGEPGIGKTTFAAGADGHIILDCENGANHLACTKSPYLNSWADIKRWLVGIRDEEHPYKVVVIDTVDWMIRRLTTHIIQSDGNEATLTLNRCHGGYGEGKGLREATIFRSILPTLDQITNRGIAVVLLAHAHRQKVTDSEGIEFDKCGPDLPSECLSVFVEWSDFVCMARTDGDKRWLQTKGDDRVIAKSRYPIAPAVKMEWSAFAGAIKSTRAETTTETKGQ